MLWKYQSFLGFIKTIEIVEFHSNKNGKNMVFSSCWTQVNEDFLLMQDGNYESTSN